MSTGFVTWFDFCTHLPMNGASKTQTVIFIAHFINHLWFVNERYTLLTAMTFSDSKNRVAAEFTAFLRDWETS